MAGATGTGQARASIFISYRRAGTSGYGGRLQDDLRDHFGRERVFRDIDSIQPGADFAEVIQQAVAQAAVVLALIGSNWLNARNEAGGRRLDDPDDFVRLEIESAFDQGIVVVPVLVEGARMPPSTQLPPSISRLGRTQAIELTDERWDYDLGRLVKALEGLLVRAEEPSPSPTPSPEGAAPGSGALTIPAGTPVVSTAEEPVPTPVPLAPVPTPVPEERGGGRPAGNRRLLGAVGLVVLLVVGLAVVLTASGGQAKVKVPGVLDQDGAVALAALERAGLVGRTEMVASDKPRGLVVGQDPGPGAEVEEGAVIRLTISDPAKVAVPAVVNLPRADAVAALNAAGLVVTAVEAPDGLVAAGLVLSQTPQPSALLDKGAMVTITVSTGPVAPPDASPTTTRPRRTTTTTVGRTTTTTGAGTTTTRLSTTTIRRVTTTIRF